MRFLGAVLWLCCVFVNSLFGSEKFERASSDFAGNLISNLEADKFDYWRGTDNQPAGGIVMRAFYDVDRDGNLDLFLRSSLEDGWSCYLASEVDDFTIAGRNIYLGKDVGAHVRENGNGGVIFSTTYSHALDFLSVTSTKFSGGTFSKTSVVTYDGIEQVAEIKAQTGWPEKYLGKGIRFDGTELSTLKSFLRDPTEGWFPFDHYYPVLSAHELLPEKLKEVMRIDPLTTEQAKKLLATLAESVAAYPTTSKPPENPSAKIGARKNFNWIWIAIGVGTFVVVALFLKIK